ncbi:HesA/MoeB/ThiF family protein [Deinococcus peraridilitoris]|uniref:Dinucleotide-utilizing enzyme possibly involved in molybdopterin or thiamin biosynthesis n=1 Tax=Deinococcus peraridilitoris (strain DSM 19664 / LMG 22246 / CIP 109416 / KR-200) TaxID=937777 RepID=L0A3D5_DEIPD|nr:HesA/MoeB/ThiF family protein [Deinococcus peraridilitoris]AFZ68408.1 dinucleotide-utilizing enzyme possibly involved in molybdopterin or thiamin biosynthesis [Deinococcus peraridilitoris DSM 19664]
MTLAREDIERYSRQLMLPGFADSMTTLRSARVLMVGVGGLGSPLSTYLVGAGVGQLTLCDGDRVSLSNLQRQPLFTAPDVGRLKTEVAAARLQALNPSVQLRTLGALNATNAPGLVRAHDVVVDASDNFTTRYLVSDACAAAGVPSVWGAAGGFEGMLSVFSGDLTLRSVFPEPGGDDCDTVGVLGPLLGVVASAMAVEVIKLLSGQGEVLLGKLWTYDALTGRVRTIALR